MRARVGPPVVALSHPREGYDQPLSVWLGRPSTGVFSLRAHRTRTGPEAPDTQWVAPIRRAPLRVLAVRFAAIHGCRPPCRQGHPGILAHPVRGCRGKLARPYGPGVLRPPSGRVSLQWTSRRDAGLALYGARINKESLPWAAGIFGGTFPGPFPASMHFGSLRSLLLLLGHPWPKGGPSPPYAPIRFACRRNSNALSPTRRVHAAG